MVVADVAGREEEAPTGVKRSAPSLSPRRVMIVDDNATTCKQLQALLQANPALEVTVQPDGQKALEELSRADYSIAITDLRMPKLDGMELLREIQERRVPVTVIVTTGHGSIDEAVQAIRMGATDFLT